MTNEPQLSIAEVLAASHAAAAEVGSGSVGRIAASCDVICIGVFFDGTYSSRDHVGQPGINWHTNVDLLEALYAPEPQAFLQHKGQQRRFLYGKYYARGIGVREDGTTVLQAGAVGTGPEGVADRVRETLREVERAIELLARDRAVCDIVLDVFGFSRGAAAARFFANQVRAHALTGDHGNVQVRFLGLFDTVSSIYLPGQSGGLSDLPLTTHNLHGTQIVHIIAEDEIRVNFPLTRAHGRQISMVGSHSDIGGGRYEPGVPETGAYDYAPGQAAGLHQWIMEKWEVSGSVLFHTRNDSGDVLTGPNVPNAVLRPSDRAMFHWSAEHGLQNVSLRVMFDAAKRAGVPFSAEVPDVVAGKDVSLHGELGSYYAEFQQYGACSDAGLKDRIRKRYAQFCGRNDQVNVVEINGQRRQVRL